MERKQVKVGDTVNFRNHIGQVLKINSHYALIKFDYGNFCMNKFGFKLVG